MLDIVGTLFRARWMILASMFILGGIVGAASYLITPVYRAEVVFTVSTPDDDSGMSKLTRQIPIAALAGFIGGGQGHGRQEALAVLRSREFTSGFIERHNLMPRLYEKEWDAHRKQWKDPEKAPTLSEASRHFDEDVRNIDEDRVTGIVRMTIDWHDPAEASQWANELLSESDRVLRQLEISEAERSLEYLRKETEHTTVVPLQDAIYRLIEDQIKRGMMARVRDAFAFRVIDRAVVPDKHDRVRPHRPAMAAVGALFGAMFAAAVALYRELGRLNRVRPTREQLSP